MLIYPNHKANEERIPSCLFQLYIQYKTDTRAIIAWLIRHGSGDYTGRPLSIKDLFRLAETVRMKAVEIPETIIFQFREAIAARTQLSQFFRKNQNHTYSDPETTNHEYFTSR